MATNSPLIEILRFVAVPISFSLIFTAAKFLTMWTDSSRDLSHLVCLMGMYLAVRFAPILAPRGKLLCSVLLGSVFVFSALFRLFVAYTTNYNPHGDSIEVSLLVILLILSLAWYQVLRVERGARSRSDAP